MANDIPQNKAPILENPGHYVTYAKFLPAQLFNTPQEFDALPDDTSFGSIIYLENGEYFCHNKIVRGKSNMRVMAKGVNLGDRDGAEIFEQQNKAFMYIVTMGPKKIAKIVPLVKMSEYTSTLFTAIEDVPSRFH